ncbi:MAG: STAS domain-containing protein [Sedimentisphaerales bacterium]|nr:STAS domain-containing protein [Sedimentisphaerales bacterium]
MIRKHKPVATLELTDHVLLVTLQRSGLLDNNEIEQLQDFLGQTLNAHRRDAIVLDLQAVEHISTAAIAFLLKIRRKLQEFGIKFKLCCVGTDKIIDAANDRFSYEIFKVLDLHRLFDITDYPGKQVARVLSEKAGSSSQTAMAC